MLTTDQLFSIAKILDNEYIGKEKTFTAERRSGIWHLSTNRCDSASFIKIFEDNKGVGIIMILGPDDDHWRSITENSYDRVKNYLASLYERQ